MTTGLRGVGEFCWINMLTAQSAAAREFFAALLGWTYDELPGIGHTIRAGGREIGGLFDLSHPNTPPGTPPQIGVMVKVESADQTAKQVTAHGGQARPPFDIGPAGRLAVCHDPAGANIDAWEPKALQGTDVDTAVHGAPSWFETLTTDVERAARFYQGVFGWEAERVQRPGPAYWLFRLGDRHVAGLMAITPEMGDLRPHWATYFTVTDIEAVARLAAQLGGRQLVPVMEALGVGRFCGLVSPQGVVFWVFQYGR